MLSAARLERRAVDLFLDLGFIPEEPGFDADDLRRALDELEEIDDWRNLILAGTAIPSSLARIAPDSLAALVRHEWILFRDLRSATLRRRPAFGDYLVQAPRRPASRARAVANVRYTTDEQYLIARGHPPKRGDFAQYRRLCALLARRPEFRGAGYSWGDAQIAGYARGGNPPLGQEYWRAVGTSHHLQQVFDDIRHLAA